MSPDVLNNGGFQQIEGGSLPVFSRIADDLTLFYAPGYLAAARTREAAEITGILSGELPFGEDMTPHYLMQAAVSAQEIRRRGQDPDNYRPTCLTLYTTLDCNLNCTYCFAKASHREGVRLSKELILAAAREVAGNCREKGERFTAVFHGGGEPSLDPRLPDLLSDLQWICKKADVPFRSYIATNGIMDPEKARWIAAHFDMVGISVDGLPELQNRQRPLRNGYESFRILERTIQNISRIQENLSFRVTVLPENFGRIPEIAAYCAGTFGAEEIHVEPVYHQHIAADLADVFCDSFLKAQAEAPAKIVYSGSRIGEVHGRYCQIFRQVLHLVPPAGTSACFAVSSQEEAEKKKLDPMQDEDVFEKLSREDPGCGQCFNRFHCARGCPDVCPAMSADLRDTGTFRCRVSRRLAEAELAGTAERLLFEPARKYGYAGVKLREDQ